MTIEYGNSLTNKTYKLSDEAEKELGVEIVGDIKVKINVLDDYDDYEVDNSNVTEDINIDEEYLNKKN